jgi:signal transduction histidine kinase
MIMDSLRDFFSINRPIVLFVYGLTFFIMGFAIFLQSRRRSRLRLARDLYWLAAFGILHGIREWGDIFIPIQETYTSPVFIELLQTIQILLLVLSFLALLMFGAMTLERRYPYLKNGVIIWGIGWGITFTVVFYLSPTFESWHVSSNIWARYLLGLPGSILAAYGLRYQAQHNIAPLKIDNVYQTLRIAGGALIVYAFIGGFTTPNADFFPANTFNNHLFSDTLGIPVQVFRSIIGFILAVTIIRALEIFEIELDRLIEQMEIERIQASERERIGQEIHDGAIQGVYSASLILESMEPHIQAGTEAARRLQQAKSVLNAVNLDLRSYMVSLRAESSRDPFVLSLEQLISNPRFQGLLDMDLQVNFEPTLRPMQVHHLIAIVQECLSNVLKHARARHVNIILKQSRSLMILSIEDNGCGFSTEITSVGYGLRSIRDRARLIGGRVDIESTLGKGTTIIVSLPEEN